MRDGSIAQFPSELEERCRGSEGLSPPRAADPATLMMTTSRS